MHSRTPWPRFAARSASLPDQRRQFEKRPMLAMQLRELVFRRRLSPVDTRSLEAERRRAGEIPRIARYEHHLIWLHAQRVARVLIDARVGLVDFKIVNR